MPTTALTTKLPKKNKDQFLSHAGLSAPLQEQCDHFSKRLHQHQADIKHGDKTHVHECPFVSELLTTGERFSREPKVEEYPSLVTSTIFSSRKCIPPIHVGEFQGSWHLSLCQGDITQSNTKGEKEIQQSGAASEAISSTGKPVVRQISSVLATTPPKHEE